MKQLCSGHIHKTTDTVCSYEKVKRVKKCNYCRTLWIDVKSVNYIHTFCDRPVGHKSKHLSVVKW